jgi:F-type H+-transporting ATPase subunit gamma
VASLKEIKTRVQSVKSTQKITSAMKMVSSAKLRKAQRAIESILPYEQKMMSILQRFLSGQTDAPVSVFTQKRAVKKVAIVVFSSNSSLCGSFNSNIQKNFYQILEQYKDLRKEDILVYPIGKKIYKSVIKKGLKPQGNFETLADKPSYDKMSELAGQLLNLFKEGQIDKVEVIYHHFKSKGIQILTTEAILPLRIEKSDKKGLNTLDYLIEPAADEVMESLLPMVVKLKLFTALLDSNASEHAARTMAMQTATENADELLIDLSLQYNKSRQQAITNELLDIIGGSLK